VKPYEYEFVTWHSPLVHTFPRHELIWHDVQNARAEHDEAEVPITV
jgi:hypothetical protein